MSPLFKIFSFVMIILGIVTVSFSIILIWLHHRHNQKVRCKCGCSVETDDPAMAAAISECLKPGLPVIGNYDRDGNFRLHVAGKNTKKQISPSDLQTVLLPPMQRLSARKVARIISSILHRK